MTVPPTKILVVDDFSPNRTAYAGWLNEIDGLEIIEANGGQEALALASEQDFAMLVLDVNMPDMGGFELAARLRRAPRSAGTPILFVTAGQTKSGCPDTDPGPHDLLVAAPIEGERLVEKARDHIAAFARRRGLELAATRPSAMRAAPDGATHSRRWHATHDPLTQLPNRALFYEHVRAAIARAQVGGLRLAIAYSDLNGFKRVNDRHGYFTGDAMIVALARRLAETVANFGSAARFGGDEFAVLIGDVGDDAGARRQFETVHCALTRPVRLLSGVDHVPVDVEIGASIGVVLYPDHPVDAFELISLAEMTAQGVKKAGGGVQLCERSAPAAGAVSTVAAAKS